MSYWRDTADGHVYFATVVLIDAENTDAPPLLVKPIDLLREERFIAVYADGEDA